MSTRSHAVSSDRSSARRDVPQLHVELPSADGLLRLQHSLSSLCLKVGMVPAFKEQRVAIVQRPSATLFTDTKAPLCNGHYWY
eukprot:551076-Amphidinium_carterae.1